ncbi:MAG TPA: hypothetical protein VFR31_14600 [Thermoanaerobaculia bacterium]|nr:hypothetical protein [Thermoanaerobaculia bacterium]
MNQTALQIAEFLSYLATIVGIPLALALFYFDRRSERWERRQRIYELPNALYNDYLRLCLEHPDLDIFDVPAPTVYSPENKKKEWIAFTILVSMMESAYLLYRDHPDQSRNSQWPGWVEYIQWWLSRPNFAEAWSMLSLQFDSDFVRFMNSLPPIQYPKEDYSYDLWTTQPPQYPERLTGVGVQTPDPAVAADG